MASTTQGPPVEFTHAHRRIITRSAPPHAIFSHSSDFSFSCVPFVSVAVAGSLRTTIPEYPYLLPGPNTVRLSHPILSLQAFPCPSSCLNELVVFNWALRSNAGREVGHDAVATLYGRLCRYGCDWRRHWSQRRAHSDVWQAATRRTRSVCSEILNSFNWLARRSLSDRVRHLLH